MYPWINIDDGMNALQCFMAQQHATALRGVRAGGYPAAAAFTEAGGWLEPPSRLSRDRRMDGAAFTPLERPAKGRGRLHASRETGGYPIASAFTETGGWPGPPSQGDAENRA